MSDAVRELKDKATQLTAKGKFPAAIETWEKVVKQSPDDVGARHKIAELHVKLGDKPKAIEGYEDVARRYAEMGLFFKASAVCRLILGLEPNHQRTQELIASLYARGKGPVPSSPVRTVAPPPSPNDEPPEEIDIEPDIAPPTASGLPSIPLFSMLDEHQLKAILGSAMEVRSYQPGQVVVTEGAPGESMFALVEGIAGVFRGWSTETQRKVATISASDIFGEVALVSRTARVATVVAETEAVALEFPRAAMEQVIARHPAVGEQLDRFCRERLLANMMRASPILRGLSPVDQKQLSAKFALRSFSTGDTIITEGQDATSVHMLLRGSCTATHHSGDRYPDLREGDLFGEVAVLTEGPTTATVKASSRVLTLELAAPVFKEVVLKDAGARLAVKTLARTRLLRTAQLDREHGVEEAQDIRV